MKLFGDFRYITLSQYFQNIIESYKSLIYPLLSFLDNLFVTNEYTKDWIFASFFLLDQVFFKFRKRNEYKWVNKLTTNKEKLSKYNLYINLVEEKLISFGIALFMGVGVSGAYYIGPLDDKINEFLIFEDNSDVGGHDILLPMLGFLFFAVPSFILFKSILFDIIVPKFKIFWHSTLMRIPFFIERRKRLLKKAKSKFEEGKVNLKEKFKIFKDLIIYSLKLGTVVFILLGLNYFLFLAES